jgi:phosphoglycerate kinase
MWQEDKIDLAKELEAKAAAKGVKFILPTDVVLADKFDAAANTKVAKVEDIPDGWMGLDNGPESTKMIQEELSECKTIIWNGAMSLKTPQLCDPARLGCCTRPRTLLCAHPDRRL